MQYRSALEASKSVRVPFPNLINHIKNHAEEPFEGFRWRIRCIAAEKHPESAITGKRTEKLFPTSLRVVKQYDSVTAAGRSANTYGGKLKFHFRNYPGQNISWIPFAHSG